VTGHEKLTALLAHIAQVLTMSKSYLDIARDVLARQPIDRQAEVMATIQVAPPTTAPTPANNPATNRDVRWGRTATRRVTANGSTPILPTIVPAAILATPAVICTRCGQHPVLPELRQLTSGWCYDCWAKEGMPAARGSTRRDTVETSAATRSDAAQRSI
jgi:hypothetical protein